jgi:hypothetical protein
MLLFRGFRTVIWKALQLLPRLHHLEPERVKSKVKVNLAASQMVLLGHFR